MTITVGGTSITFNDATTQSTAYVAPTTAQVLSATAGAQAGDVGTYGFFTIPGLTLKNPGVTTAGSTLRWAGSAQYNYQTANTTSSQPTGTWRCMGLIQTFCGCANTVAFATVFLRIS